MIDYVEAFSDSVYPGIYTKDSSVLQPLVSLCNSKSFAIQSNLRVDMCLTVNPATLKGVGKSYLCSDLSYTSIGDHTFTITEGNDQCMLKLRNHAHSIGIHIYSPIEFTYQVEPTSDKEAALKATAGVHLKWSEHSKPVNSLNAFEEKNVWILAPPSILLLSFLFL